MRPTALLCDVQGVHLHICHKVNLDSAKMFLQAPYLPYDESSLDKALGYKVF